MFLIALSSDEWEHVGNTAQGPRARWIRYPRGVIRHDDPRRVDVGVPDDEVVLAWISKQFLDGNHGSRSAGYSLEVMAKSPPHPQPTPSPEVQKLAARGLLKPPSRRLRDVLAERGQLRGPVSNAGSRAVQEQRGDGG